ncbi:MAG: ATP-dependent helicase HrpB [Myxococcales bacterium]|nr:ATP-dependent helicase HrpB [Myxococcales bacterium]
MPASLIAANATPLPIDAVLPAIVAAFTSAGRVLVVAEPGAGKTTRVPNALLMAQAFTGQCWVVQPRRMAAILTARRVAQERGETCGEVIGYSVRLEERVTAVTRIRYVTDGLLLRRLLADPQLTGIGALVFDEFHERRAAMDVGLAVAKRLQATTRPQLRLAVMSATLDSEKLAQWLDPAPLIAATGRVFPVQVEHDGQLDTRRLEERVATAVRKALQTSADGDVLVFLPGAGEIRRCQEQLAKMALGETLVMPLHGSLPLRDQEAAIAPTALRKVILSTNIAETSLTLPHVVTVIDSGLARTAGFANWSGLDTLHVQPISRASAAQRAGRAGRVRPGTCIRLYTAFDHDHRPAFDTAELARSDVAEHVLALASLPPELQPDGDGFWLTPPPAQAQQSARELLLRLGAVTSHASDGSRLQLTPTGRQMLRWPLPPRWARVVVAGEALGAGHTCATVAALLNERDVRQGEEKSTFAAPHGHSDVLQLLQDFEACRRGAQPRDRGLSRTGYLNAKVAVDQLLGLVQRPDDSKVDTESALGLALLHGFGDRLARRRSAQAADVEMVGGAALRLPAETQVTQAQWMLVLHAEERRDGKTRANWLRVAHGVDPEQIIEVLADEVTTETTLTLEGKRVVQRERTLCGGLQLEARTLQTQPSAQVAALLVQTASASQWRDLLDLEAWAQLAERVRFAKDVAGLTHLPVCDEMFLLQIATDAAQFCTQLGQLQQADLLGLVRAAIDGSRTGGGGLSQLEQAAPETMVLPGGKRLRIVYPVGQPPWTQSRMQDFFGLDDGPKVAFGQVAVVLHLLAPNQRPVQVTTDLAGFWLRHWPAIRRQLCRLYPRHLWPEDPIGAKPPPPGRPR